MIISGAWTVKSLPSHYILNIPSVGLRLAQIVPFRKITDADLQPYNGTHPRKMRGIPMPDYLYKFYGLEKSDETASETIQVRVTPTDKMAIEARAIESGLTVSEYLRSLILG